MKHIIRIIVLAVAFVTGLSTISAQTVHVEVIQKVATLPSTATNYLEDPFRYFDVVAYAYGVGNEGLEVFCNIDFSLNDGTFYLRTNMLYEPRHKIVLHEGMNKLKRDDLLRQFRGHPDNNIDLTKPLRVQLLPEGTYTLCLDVFRWTDRLNPAAVPISDGNCPSYEICYSGSAPELVSPTTGGQVAMNGTMVLAPNRKINFFWTPVISNCSGNKSRFRYILKVAKVLQGQNYEDAIKYNPTVFSAEVRNGNYAVLDTLRDIKVQMERGALYVAQVLAEKINTGRDMDAFIIANDGKSQPVPFYWEQAPDELWGYYDSDYYVEVDVEEPEEGEEADGLEGLTQWSGGVEESSELETIIEEMPELNLVPNPKRNYVLSDGYYTIPMANDIEVGFTPTTYKALKQSVYSLALYENVDWDVDSITAGEPLYIEEIGAVADREAVRRTLAGWGSELQQGEIYYMELSNDFTVGYWNYSVADTNFYVNDMLAEHIHDTISREFVEDELTLTDGFFFQWGDDPEAPSFVTPQWTAPVDRSGDDIYDPKNNKLPVSLPEVQKGTFSVSWTPVQDVTPGDEVEYEINVYELKPGQTLEEAVSENPLLVSRTVTDANSIPESDSQFFKVFSTKKTYVMTLSTSVDGESETFYHFENGNEALPIVFKIVK